ncbi:MAG: AbrB/MazE/SpoVT family DNA-binding domain-containing protein [Bacteroidota bacterium]
MIVKLIQIGNSKGLRLPKAVIDKYDLDRELELIDTEDGILIKPVSESRVGWEAKFLEANSEPGEDDDFSDFLSVTEDFDTKEWEW